MICLFASQFPHFVEQFLDRGRKLRRRFREETVTDLLMSGLITAGAGQIIVEFPDEPSTGADMEWNFADPQNSTFFRLILQAKQAFGNGSIWKRHSYRELRHVTGSGPKLQAQVLCDTARQSHTPTYPLYIFYHTAKTCELARKSGNTTVAGVNVADGFVIEHLVKRATTRAERTNNRSLRTIEPMLAPLTILFCPPTIERFPPQAYAPNAISRPLQLASTPGGRFLGFPFPPTPDEIRDRILNIRALTLSSFPNEPSYEVPPLMRGIPDDVQDILRRREEGAEPIRKLDRLRLTFISRDPRI